MTKTISLATAALLFCFASFTASAQGDGQQVLDAWAKLAVGGTWTASRGGADRLDHSYRWVVPGKLMQLDGRGGPLPFVAMISVDSSSKQCAWTSFNDDGTVVKGTLTQPSDGVWNYEEKGPGPQGEHRYKGKITRVDADTIKEEVSEFVVNGKPQPLAPATWKRTAQSTRKDFEEYCQTFQGRWVGEVTWVADWPGLGKRGEKVTAYYQGRTTEDGKAFAGTFYAGSGSATGVTVYDAAAKQIKGFFVDSGGGYSESVSYKHDGKWHDRITGSLVDGTTTTGQNTLTISDGGDTHRWSGAGTIGDKPTDPLKDVWHRVSKK